VSAGKPPAGPIDLVVPAEASGARLDRFLAGAVAVSRSELQRWIEAGRVTVGGEPRAPAAKVRAGEQVRVLPAPPPATSATPDADVPFAILHTDDDLVVVDKPPGVVVHPARGHERGTLVNGLLALGLFSREALAEAGEAGQAVESTRPGIVHRLDKGTSGVLVVARTPEAREALKKQFQAHSIERLYEALVVGVASARTWATLHGRHPRDRMRFTTRVLRGKRAVTHVRVLKAMAGSTHVACSLETGRTHQIRVHLAEGGTPVLGDPLYGRPPADPRIRRIAEQLGHQALHARVLGFVHPRSGRVMRFESPPPPDFLEALDQLRRL
jgi:23S rRNA pseudouridine1911/1915/1917 synthase